MIASFGGNISVNAHSVADGSSGAYLALPSRLLGTEYYVIAHINTDVTTAAATRDVTQFGVVALHDETVLDVTLPAGVHVTNSGYGTYRNGQVISMILAKHQTYQVFAFIVEVLYEIRWCLHMRTE